jgi:amidase
VQRDTLGAFVPGPELRIEGTAEGPLKGLDFAAKDIFDIAGFVTGCGNPDWARSHPPATLTAWAVEAWLGAGATLVGKTITDELAYSLNGQNAHYGTPTNVNAPGRIPGGSSCGSASAVAGGLVDAIAGSTACARATAGCRSAASCRSRPASTRSAGSRATPGCCAGPEKRCSARTARQRR